MHKNFMKRAIELAKLGGSNVFPNPQVGAVIVKDNQIIAEGYHQVFGGDHAEVNAFNQATSDVSGAEMYVTLEPCSHYGKTPPCALKIIEKGIKKVHVATKDPNPLVAGKGIQLLKDAGVEVVLGELQKESDTLNQHFYYFIKHKIPYVTLKMATSLDGKYATSTGESKWITSEASRRDVHIERSKHQSILVGIQTILTDDPSLNVRLEGYHHQQPLRIVLDTFGKISKDKKVITDGLPTLIVTSHMSEETKKMLEAHQVDVMMCQSTDGHIDLIDMLNQLGNRGIQSVFIEGGKTVHESFLRQQLVNEVITYIAPKIIGGTQSINQLNISYMTEVLELKHIHQDFIDNDIKIKGVLTSCLQEL